MEIKAKKIICTVTNDLSQDQRMHRICSTLVNGGFDVLCIGRQLENSLPLDEQQFKTKRINCFFTKGIFFYAEYNIRLLSYLLLQQVDIINSVDLDTLPAGRLASFFKSSTFIFDAHELFTEVPELTGHRFKKKIWSIVESSFISGRMGCYTVNAQVATELKRRTGKEFDVIYNYPTVKYTHRAKDIQKPIQLVYQGVLNEGRGLLELIEAIGSNENYMLQIIGRGDIETKIMELAKRHHNVILHGFVPPSKLHELTMQFHIGLNLLIHSSENYVYSSANKFFDYIMAGLPVISMNFPEYRKVNDEHNIGILIEDLTKDSIIHAIEMIKLNYKEFSDNCAKASQELSWSTQEKRLLDIYNSQ